jgi:peptide/nickel transport system substrate-binding protein
MRSRRIGLTVLAALTFITVITVLHGPAAAAPESTMTWGVHVTLASRWLDPAETEALVTPFLVLYALHDAVVKPMTGAVTGPSLAESWTMSRDGLVYEFVLRKNVRFHNGEPVTSDDVKFSFERYKGAAAKLLKDRVKEIQTPDPGRVRIVLKEPWPDFMTFYGTTASGAAWVVPKKYLEKVGEEGFKKAPIGAGPYRLVSFNPGVEMVLEAFEGYWRKRPAVKRLVFRTITDETTRAAAVKRGEVDLIYLVSGPVAEELKRTPGFKVASPLPSVGQFWLDFPEQGNPKSPWHDQRVRLAASLAVDRKAVSEAEWLGFARPSGNIVPKALEFALELPPHPYDPVRAKALLAEAGYPGGFDGGDFTPFPPYNSMGEAIANYLRAVGIRTRIKNMERAAFLTAWREKKIPGVIMALVAPSGNAATRLEPFVTRDGFYSYSAIPEAEDLYARQSREVDRKKREAMLHQIQRLIHDRVTHAPLMESAFLWAIGPRVDESGLSLIPGHAYSAPYEDVKLKRP